jgi:hypothetical protein
VADRHPSGQLRAAEIGGTACPTPQAGRQASLQNVGCVNRESRDDIIEDRVCCVVAQRMKFQTLCCLQARYRGGAAVELRRVISRYGDGAILANSMRYDSHTHFSSSRTITHQACAWGSATYLTQPVLSLLAVIAVQTPRAADNRTPQGDYRHCLTTLSSQSSESRPTIYNLRSAISYLPLHTCCPAISTHSE